MRAIVPVIGHEFFSAVPSLKERVVELILNLGLEYFWVTIGNIRELHNADPCKIEIPLIIIAHENGNSLSGDDKSDLYVPLLKKFPLARLVECNYDRIPLELFKRGVAVSLWRREISSDVVKIAIQNIYQKLSSPDLNIETLADEIHVSYATLERNFKSALGQSVYQFIVKKRIEEANRLLSSTKLPVYSIASAVGYPDLPSFDRVYKKKMKVTPLEFRRSTLSENVKPVIEKNNVLSKLNNTLLKNAYR